MVELIKSLGEYTIIRATLFVALKRKWSLVCLDAPTVHLHHFLVCEHWLGPTRSSGQGLSQDDNRESTPSPR